MRVFRSYLWEYSSRQILIFFKWRLVTRLLGLPVLGDPPVNWENYDPDKLAGSRNSHPANLIQREVLAKDRRALVIYGGMHFLRKKVDLVDSKDENFILPGDSDPTLVALLESQSGSKVFTIWTHTLTPWNLGEDKVTVEAGLHLWSYPSLAKFSGTTLGAQKFSSFYPGVISWITIENIHRSLKARPNVRIEDQFDALLYLGPPSNIRYSELPIERCTDVAYIEMRSHCPTGQHRSNFTFPWFISSASIGM